MESAIRVIDAINERIGRAIAWLTLGCVAVCFATVYLRYVLGRGYIWLQELYVWEHAITFLAGAGYTFLHGGHVRVDIFYARMTLRAKAWMDLIGTVVFLFPFVGLILVKSWPYFWVAFIRGEHSEQPDGMPSLWILKSMLVVFCIVVLLQAVAMLLRCILVLRGREEFMAAAPGQH